jgi:hypothetical protein
LRPSMKETLSFRCTTIIAGLLCFLAFYHICLLFALSFAWLSFSDLHVINAIAKARNGFEIAFTALQFISTIWTASWALDIWSIRLGCQQDPYQKVRSHTLEYIFRTEVMQCLTFATGSSVLVPSIYSSINPVILRSCHCGPAGQMAHPYSRDCTS